MTLLPMFQCIVILFTHVYQVCVLRVVITLNDDNDDDAAPQQDVLSSANIFCLPRLVVIMNCSKSN